MAERYSPTSSEIEFAENHMTDEQQIASSRHERMREGLRKIGIDGYLTFDVSGHDYFKKEEVRGIIDGHSIHLVRATGFEGTQDGETMTSTDAWVVWEKLAPIAAELFEGDVIQAANSIGR